MKKNIRLKIELLIVMLLVGFVAFIYWPTAEPPGLPIVIFIGDSRTALSSVCKSYPEFIQEGLGSKFRIVNAGVSANAVVRGPDHPRYRDSDACKQALKLAGSKGAAVFVMMLGTNDCRPDFNAERFKLQYRELIDEFMSTSPSARCIVVLPLPIMPGKYEFVEKHRPSVCAAMREMVAEYNKDNKQAIELVDLEGDFAGKPELFYDGIHQNDAGNFIVATRLTTQLAR